MRLAYLLLALLLAKDPWFSIELRVYPYVSIAPSTIIVKVRIEPRPENRAYSITIDGTGDYFSDSWWELEGDRAPLVQPDRRYPDIPAGEYTITAKLIKVVNQQDVKVDVVTRNIIVQ